MNTESLLKALKLGMQGEMDSVTHYQKAAMDSTDDVKDFFEARIREEKLHYNYLLQYYKKLDAGVEPDDLTAELAKNEVNSPMISKEFAQRIGQSQILFSAISTALLLEKNGMDFYRHSAENTENLTLKAFFNELVRWEEQHYQDLLSIQKEAEIHYWEINDFQPF